MSKNGLFTPVVAKDIDKIATPPFRLGDSCFSSLKFLMGHLDKEKACSVTP